jgi:hypothetical protein
MHSKSSASISQAYCERAKKQSKTIPAGDEDSTTPSANFPYCGKRARLWPNWWNAGPEPLKARNPEKGISRKLRLGIS